MSFVRKKVLIQPPRHTRGARAAQALAPRERLRCAKTQRGDKYKLNNGVFSLIKNNSLILVSWCLCGKIPEQVLNISDTR